MSFHQSFLHIVEPSIVTQVCQLEFSHHGSDTGCWLQTQAVWRPSMILLYEEWWDRRDSNPHGHYAARLKVLYRDHFGVCPILVPPLGFEPRLVGLRVRYASRNILEGCRILFLLNVTTRTNMEHPSVTYVYHVSWRSPTKLTFQIFEDCVDSHQVRISSYISSSAYHRLSIVIGPRCWIWTNVILRPKRSAMPD